MVCHTRSLLIELKIDEVFCSNLLPWSLHGYSVNEELQTTVKSNMIHFNTEKYVNPVQFHKILLFSHPFNRENNDLLERRTVGERLLSLLVNATRVNVFKFTFSVTAKTLRHR